MSLTELEFPDDDFPFRPTPSDLAMMVGLEPDQADRMALDELADAMLVWAEGREVERLIDDAVERIWTEELAAAIRDGLLRVAADEDENWRAAACDALEVFDRSPSASAVARAVVERFAAKLAQNDHSPFFCACCLDDAVAAAPREARRSLALQMATVARRNAEVSEAELRLSVANALSCPAVERLGTVERRVAVRSRLGRIGSLGRRSTPALAAELRTIALESLPDRPDEDDVWNAVCQELLTDRAQPSCN
jgi:hypothetical protein